MLKFLFATLILFSISQIAFCRSMDTVYYHGNYAIKIDSIQIEGNKITDPDVITRELTFGVGDTLTPKIAEYNSNRIYSLGIFTWVSLIPYRVGNENFLLIFVSESWYIYPIPFLEFQDKDWKKISYGLDFVVRNFRGENETLRAIAAFGYDPKLILEYNRPYIIRSQEIYLDMEVYYQNAKNKSENAFNLYGKDFNQKFIGGYIDLGKRFNLFNRFDLQVGYDYVENPVFIKGISASNNRIDRQYSLGASYSYDTRDLTQFPAVGTYANASYFFEGLGLNDINYQIANIDLRKYFVIGDDLRFKFRLATRMTFGKLVPYYNYSYFGYDERIRGYFNKEMEGNNLYFGSVEFNYPLIKDLNINFDFVPIIPKSLLTYRFAVYAELFSDTGTVTNWGQPLSIRHLYSGYGTGLIFLVLPYNLLRLEYAFNDLGQPQFILGLGLSF